MMLKRIVKVGIWNDFILLINLLICFFCVICRVVDRIKFKRVLMLKIGIFVVLEMFYMKREYFI